MLEFEMQELTSEYTVKLEELDEELERLYRASGSLETISEAQYSGYCNQIERFDGLEEWTGVIYDEFCEVYNEDYIFAYKRYLDSIDALIADIQSLIQNKEAEKLYVKEEMQREIVRWTERYRDLGQTEDV